MKGKVMNRHTAKRVREDYRRKMPVALISEKYGITPSFLFCDIS